MNPKELIDHFGGIGATARALSVKAPSVSEWKAKGAVPIGRQFQAEVLTGGALRAVRPDTAKGLSREAMKQEAA
jgi:hypothetical protein